MKGCHIEDELGAKWLQTMQNKTKQNEITKTTKKMIQVVVRD